MPRRESSTNPTQQAILNRINRLKGAIAKANEYLETGKHADWSGFKPHFVTKVRNGKPLPPHRDWVRNVFLPSAERELKRSELLLDRLE